MSTVESSSSPGETREIPVISCTASLVEGALLRKFASERSDSQEYCDASFRKSVVSIVQNFELFSPEVRNQVLQRLLDQATENCTQREVMQQFIREYYSESLNKLNAHIDQAIDQPQLCICCGHSSLSASAIIENPVTHERSLPSNFNPLKRENVLLASYQCLEEWAVFLAHMIRVVQSLALGRCQQAILSGAAVRIDCLTGEQATISEAESYSLITRHLVLTTLFPDDLELQATVMEKIILDTTARSTAENMLSVELAHLNLSDVPAGVEVITWAFKQSEIEGPYSTGVNILLEQDGKEPIFYSTCGIGDLSNPQERAAAVRDNERRSAAFLEAVATGQSLVNLTHKRETRYVHELSEVRRATAATSHD